VEIQKLRSGAASSEYTAPPGLEFCWDCGSTNMPRLTALKMAVCKNLAAPGEENCRCQNYFGMDDRGGVAFEFPPP
jgi:hypothetical protein